MLADAWMKTKPSSKRKGICFWCLTSGSSSIQKETRKVPICDSAAPHKVVCGHCLFLTPPPPSPAVSCVLPWWESHLPLWASHPCCWSSRHTGSSKEGYQSHCLSSCAHGAKATFFSTSPSSRRCLQVEQVKQSEVQSGTGINQTERGHLACGALGLHLTFLHSFSL